MEIVNILYNGNGVTNYTYSTKDNTLINTSFVNTTFGDTSDYIELFITDESGETLTYDYDFKDYYTSAEVSTGTNRFSAVLVDPEKDVKNRGYNRGITLVQYNFLKKLFNSSISNQYWIKEISPSRLELKLSSQTISGDSMRAGVTQYQTYVATKNYFSDFYLNFGNNQLVIAVNAAYSFDGQNSNLLIKLYEPLPFEYDIKSQLWIVDKIAESVSYQVTIDVEVEETVDINKLRGPNYKVQVFDQIGQTTPYYNYNSLFSTNISSSRQQLASYYEDKSVGINVDYSNFENFVHFSSITERLENFKYKLGLLENYNAQIIAQKSVVGSQNASITSASIVSIENSIDQLIEKFDTYEYFLYYESSSFAWPKSGSVKPYSLYSITSSQASNWLGSETTVPTQATMSMLYSASYYDYNNPNVLSNTIPQYLQDDPSNAPYVTFLNMIGQHFDNVWLYYKDVSNRFNATNDPNTGISLDLVADALRGLGIQLYTNTNISDNVYYSLLGINQSGTLLPPTGSEKISSYVTSSIATLPYDQIQKEIYKRVYHNLPYLLKTRGTERGVKALIACYGIPDSILTVREFGGYDRFEQPGVVEENNQKIHFVTSSNEVSESVLTPYATLQYFDNDNRKNLFDVEVGFSPSDKINADISSSLGYFYIDNLIGRPGDQYSSSYSALDSLKNTYFQKYSGSYSVWDYIRTIKYYNNSLFKMLRDFVPARASLSSGIIIKPHILERSKYARHEPITNIHNNYSESIETYEITGSSANSYTVPTTKMYVVTSSIGYIPVTKSFGYENYTGEFQGTEMIASSMNSISDQSENSNNVSASLGTIRVNRGALYQNVTASVRSKRFFDLDFSYNTNVPVNYGIITQSISRSQVDNFSTYEDPMSPYAQLQDTNYYLRSFTDSRYYGSKTTSATYTTYTNGDKSYGKTAAVDKIKYQYAYLVDIYSSSIVLPRRSNAQIKYLIDNNRNVLNLTKANNNIFEVQNVFKSGETTDVALFEYDERNPYSQLLANNPTLQIFEGGFRYLPMLHNLSGSATRQGFFVTNPIEVIIPGSGGGGITPEQLNPNNFIVYSAGIAIRIGGPSSPSFRYTGSIRVEVADGVTTFPANIQFDVKWGFTAYDTNDFVVANQSGTTRLTLVAGQVSTTTRIVFSGEENQGGDPNGPQDPFVNDTDDVIGGPAPYIDKVYGPTGSGGSGAAAFTYYTTYVTSSQPCVFYNTASNQLVFNNTIAQYYKTNGLTFDSTSDLHWSQSILDRVVTQFNIEPGDVITFFDSASALGWDERFEYSIISTSVTGSGTGSRLIANLTTTPNLALFTSQSVTPDSTTNANFRGCRYVLFKRVPDETNVMLRYDPKDSSIVEEGLLYPQYLDLEVRRNAGNVVKDLKSNNLI